MRDARSVVGDLKAEQRTLLNRVQDATGINAPNFSQSLARMSVGVGMLGAALVVRSQEGAQGTRWYEYRPERSVARIFRRRETHEPDDDRGQASAFSA
jgi:hypothetical protein